MRSYSNYQLATYFNRLCDFERDGLTNPGSCGTHSFSQPQFDL
jgi:hypothetical protein